MAPARISDQEQTILDAVSTDRLMHATESIAQWERLSGTEDEKKAFDWIESQLRESGLEPVRYEHPALVSWPESATLTLTTGDAEIIEIPCATHAFGLSTPEDGISSMLVDAGSGDVEDLTGEDLRGRIVLVDGIIAPNRNLTVESAGVAASIWVAGSRLHERGLSPIWGTPTPETANLLPRTPSVSVLAEHGERIKALLEQGPVTATIHTQVYTAWRYLPLLTADIKPARQDADANTFVLFSGHVDSWYYGAMDNGTANATMLEVAAILANRIDDLRRGVRLAFWSGHSHARYAGSAWYADEFWLELHDRCVAHINVDSVGAKDATVLSEGNNMAELRDFVSDAIEPIAGQRLNRRRFGRAGDQSFWGVGIPAALMSLSAQPPENADPVLLALHDQIAGGKSASGGLGSWWHTPEDTIDKIDPDNLHRDASIYTLLLYRLTTTPVLPFDFRLTVAELRERIEELQEAGGNRISLGRLIAEVDSLADRLQRLQTVADDESDDERARRINQCLMEVGHALIPVDYTALGQFDHDLAVPTSPLPGLSRIPELSSLDTSGSDYQLLVTRLRRERNRAIHGVRLARRAIEDALRDLS
ncbi:MAG: M28 family peptidase [Sphaerobacteraceae bacterium]|nr:MAG: M28 family peptidase [Sphaerobacteraceae bacterium]